MRNTRRGEVSLEMAGEVRTVVFDWDALSRLEAALGEDFDQKIAQAGYKMDLPVLAIALAAGLAKGWSEVTPELVREAAPPVLVTMEVLGKALNLAFYGTEEAPEATENPPEMGRPSPQDGSSTTGEKAPSDLD